MCSLTVWYNCTRHRACTAIRAPTFPPQDWWIYQKDRCLHDERLYRQGQESRHGSSRYQDAGTRASEETRGAAEAEVRGLTVVYD